MNSLPCADSESGTVTNDSRLVARYRAAYLEAKTAVACGRFVELCGWILGIVLVIGGLVLLTSNTRDGVLSMMAGVLVMVVFRLLGALGCAIGQMLRATLDTAVFSATFLDEQQKKMVLDI